MFGIWNELYVRNFACVGRAEEHVGVRQLELLYACMGGIPEGVCRSVHAGSLPVKPAGGNVVRNFLAATINAGAQRRLLHIIRKHLTGVRADFYPVADLLFDFLRYDVLNRHANRRVAGQIQRLPDIRRQLVRRDRSCLNSISRKKTGNDQVGGKAFARAERAPVPFAVICLCIGDHEALAAQLHGAFAVDGFQNQIALIVGVPVGNGGREPGFQYVDHALQPFGGNGTILSNGLASVVQRFALVNDFRNTGDPADNAVQRYAADAGQIVADGDAVLFGRIQIFDQLGDISVVVLFQRLIPDVQRRVKREALLFVAADAR